MKKLMVFVCAAALLLSLCACRKDDPYEKITFTPGGVISVIELTERHSDVELKVSDDDAWKVEYYANKYDEYSVSVKDGVLKIECACSHNSGFLSDLKQGLFNPVGIDKRGLPTIVYVPGSFCGDLKLYNNAGGITIDGLTLGKAEIENNAGSVYIKNSTAAETSVVTGAGNVEASGNMGSVKISTGLGNAELSGDAESAEITTELGNVKLSRLTVSALKITTELGNIEGSLTGKESDYKITLDGGTGKSNLSNTDSGEKTLTIKRTMGSITIAFVE